MPVPDSLVLASEVIGFLSFGFTLLTALGVYADLIKTLRGAPSTIPIVLGNLREEIKYEQQLCRAKMKAVDPFNVLPDRRSGRKSRHEYSKLLSATLRHMWTEFCNIEKAFVTDGQYGHSADQDDSDEKGSGRRRRTSERPKPINRQSFIKGRMGWIEAGLSTDRQTYYNTDLTHRFVWWWKLDDVNNLAQQVQRIQIRRIERDVYETNILTKRSLRLYGDRFGIDIYHSSNDSSDQGGAGGGSGSDNGGGGPRGGHASSRRHSGVVVRDPRTSDRRRSRNGGAPRGGIREISEKEIIRRRASSPEESPPPPRRPPSASGSRREAPRRASVVYEYEVVDPGRIHVEYGDPGQDQSWQQGRQRSYSRPRRGSVD